MLRRGLIALCLCLVLSEDISFDAIVDTDGTTARFIYSEGDDLMGSVSDFCGKYMANATMTENCQKALLAQIESIQAERRIPPMKLQVQVSTDGKTATFEHKQGADVRLEAMQFCSKYVQPDDISQCADALVTGARQHAMLANMTVWEKLFGEQVVLPGGRIAPTNDVLSGKKFVAVLFAADWCGPCRQFVPKLIKMYERHLKRRKKVEVIWVSASKTKEATDEYHKEMPWPAMVYSPERQAALQQVFGVVGFPTLLILEGKDARLITSEGVQKINADNSGMGFPYRTPAQRAGVVLRGSMRLLRSIFSIFRRKKKN